MNSNGFGVATGELTGYAKRTRDIATELHTLATHRLAGVRKITEHSLGPIGKDSGFAAALGSFAESLEHQVAGVGRNADKLGDSVAKAAADFRAQDDERAADILDLIRGKKP